MSMAGGTSRSRTVVRLPAALPNTLAPTAIGLAKAYLNTSDVDHLTALQKAGNFLLGKSTTRTYAPVDGILAAQLDQIFGGTTYRTSVKTGFYDQLALGLYKPAGDLNMYSTGQYVDLVRASRTGANANLAAWDLGLGILGAAAVGATMTEWINGTKAEVNELSSGQFFDTLGLAGALYGLAAVHENFDPTTGSFAAAGSLADLASILVGTQVPGTGGFSFTTSAAPAAGDETTQETAYALLALSTLNPIAYATQIDSGANFLMNTQLATGGWENFTGDGENNEITGEALLAASGVVPEPSALVLTSIALVTIATTLRRREQVF